MKKLSLFIFSLFSVMAMSACADDEERDIDMDPGDNEPGITDPDDRYRERNYRDDKRFEMPDEDDFNLPDDELDERRDRTEGINDEEKEDEVEPEETVE